MSVLSGIIETQRNEKEKMVNNKRYSISGFSFGSEGMFNLMVKTLNNANYGSATSIELGIELTPDERLELIKLLINADSKENN
jgi:hypothetical protein